jgi:hypothetical protein
MPLIQTDLSYRFSTIISFFLNKDTPPSNLMTTNQDAFLRSAGAIASEKVRYVELVLPAMGKLPFRSDDERVIQTLIVKGYIGSS